MGGPPTGVKARSTKANACEGISKLTVTQKILDEFPQLAKLGFGVGDKIVAGKPFDGIADIDGFKIGTCDGSCTLSRPTVDATKSFGWKTEFIKKYFPHELGTLASLKKSPPAEQCYQPSFTDHIAQSFMEAIGAADDATRADYELTGKIGKGTATAKDLKRIKSFIEKRIKALKVQKKDTKFLELGLKLVELRIAKAKSMLSKK